jgi:hypothetical protein
MLGELSFLLKAAIVPRKDVSPEALCLSKPNSASPVMVNPSLLILLSAAQAFAQQSAWGQCK